MVNIPNIKFQILKAVEELNQQIPPECQLPLSPDTRLYGNGGWLDSMGLVNLIVLVEERIFDEFGIEITLSDDRLFSSQDNPFRTIMTLSEYVGSLIETSA